MKTTATSLGLAVVGAVTLLMVSGCDGIDKALNDGGDTTCGTYLAMDDHDKQVTITKYLQQVTGKDQVADGAVKFATAGIGGLCSLPGKSDVHIKDITNLKVTLSGVVPTPTTHR